MIKVTYRGKVPSGYTDSGIDDTVFCIDEKKFDTMPDIAKLAKRDAYMCNDVEFIKVVAVEHDYKGVIGWMTTIYAGIEMHYDSYFGKSFPEYITEYRS